MQIFNFFGIRSKVLLKDRNFIKSIKKPSNQLLLRKYISKTTTKY